MEKLKEKINKYKRRMKASLRFISNHPLTKENKLSAYYRYLRFHLVQLVNHKKPMKHNFIDDIKFYASMGDGGIVGNIYVGLADFEEMAFLVHYLKPNDLFIDVGANVGVYTLLASGICKSKSIAIEPIPGTFKKLEKNVKLNQLTQYVYCINVGIGSEETYLDFLITSNNSWNRVATSDAFESSKKIKLKIITSDLLIDRGNLPNLLKIDVEGYEFQALQGATNCLQCNELKAIIIELTQHSIRYGHDDNEIIEILYNAGFLPYHYDPFSRLLTKINHKNSKSLNTIFIRDIGSVYERLRAAPKRKILSSLI